MEVSNEIGKKIKSSRDKYKLVCWNKENLIPMKDIISFIAIPLERSSQHLGSCNGWTKLYNTEHQLEISGGLWNGTEWLSSIQYKEKLDNPYNNYVNPFYLWGILNENGKKFFLDYYSDELKALLSDQEENIRHLKNKLKSANAEYIKTKQQIVDLKSLEPTKSRRQ